MQPMADAITVLGSRHGLGFDPHGRRVTLVRSEVYGDLHARLAAGITVGGRTRVLPLTDAFEPAALWPLDDQLRLPLLPLADWHSGAAPRLRDGKLDDPQNLLGKAGLTVTAGA